MKLLECIPNVSEGKDRGKIDAVAAVISAAEGVKLLDVCRDPDHHRTVFTFIGPSGKLEEAALAALGRALELIDMREHRGVHPR
ncbi:MAG TPA: glutamate formiminotransferase, partial [Syntrophales bacterium]|nr:glutamate formiminotransferase [Syntrophales bacterium]